ncbi:MAG: DsbE family thiol:disulfide interchange protein [Burkholderiaceae bacterium]
MRSLRFIIPLLLFAAIGMFLYKGLSNDPRIIPSPLVGKPAPDFSLPILGADGRAWGPEEMRGKVWLLNIWGSWCAACQIEHPLFNQIARDGTLPLVGLAWKDDPQASARWLDRLGDPYTVVISDIQGRAAIDYGVYGAPESFLIDKRGVIRFKQTGPFSPESIRDTLMPLVRELEAEPET